MVKKTTFRITLLISLALAACTPKSENTETADETAASETDAASEDWKQMDDFHMLMAESYHPYKDSANLEPAKTLAPEMATMAASWQSSTLPAKVDTEEMKNQLSDLKSETENLVALVASGDDTQIGASLTKVHDAFHKIQEGWYGGAKDHGEHH
ncbi:MAG: hypothetical protein HC859_13095 [Bacteroidia bacterium]|nr:hypothetical protein [Bacteroidia bacterium]